MAVSHFYHSSPNRRDRDGVVSRPHQKSRTLLSRRENWCRNFLRIPAMGVGKVFAVKFFTFLRTFVDFLSDVLFWLVNRNQTEFLPPISNLILMDSATTLAAKIRTRKLTSKEVVESFIARIEAVNPILNAVVDDNFVEALKEADRIDKFVASGEKNEKQIAADTPFLGVPFTTKDCFSMKGLHQTVGLVSRKDKVAEDDAACVRLMRDAGAIPLAVTNVSELCMWWESNNNVYGRTCNPYNTTRIVGGSSGGEGCIISSAGSVFGVGSDIGGSIRMPAFFNGIFGHKPTSGIVPNEGQLPVAEGDRAIYLTTGPMCRFASDLLPMLKVLAGPNLNKLKLDQKVKLTDVKFYYMEDEGASNVTSKVHPEIRKALRKVVYSLKKTYDIDAQLTNIKLMRNAPHIWSMLMGKDPPSFSAEMTERQGEVRAGWELLKWLVRCSDHTLPAILLALFEGCTNSDDYPKFSEMCERLKEEFQSLLGSDGVFLFPTHPRPAPYHNQPVLMPFNFSYTAIFNVLEMPSTHCPMGLSNDGLPLGIQVVANKYNDHLCLAVAEQIEKFFGGWVSPSNVL